MVFFDSDDYEEVIYCHCSVCGGHIYEGDSYYIDDDGNAVCDECLSEWATQHLTMVTADSESDRKEREADDYYDRVNGK